MPIAAPNNPTKLIGCLDLLAGLWLFVSSLIMAANAALAWDLAMAGFVIAVLAGARFLGYRKGWPSWINFLLGIWTAASPWIVVRAATPAMMWNAVVTGLLIAILALASAMYTDVEPLA
jgi:hypothetical protein